MHCMVLKRITQSYWDLSVLGKDCIVFDYFPATIQIFTPEVELFDERKLSVYDPLAHTLKCGSTLQFEQMQNK